MVSRFIRFRWPAGRVPDAPRYRFRRFPVPGSHVNNARYSPFRFPWCIDVGANLSTRPRPFICPFIRPLRT